MAQPWHLPLDSGPTIKKRIDTVYQPTLLKHFCNIDIHTQPTQEVKTGIMCDIGTFNKEVHHIHQLIGAGMSVARLVTADLKLSDCTDILKSIRKTVYSYSMEMKTIYPLAILIDIKGPDILTGELKGGAVEIIADTVIRLTKDSVWQECGTSECIYIGYSELTSLHHGDTIFIETLTGVKAKLTVSEVGYDSLECNVIIGGLIGSNMVVYIVPGTTQIPSEDSSQSLCESSVEYSKDDETDTMEKIAWAIKARIDGFIISNIKTLRGISEVRKAVERFGGDSILLVSIDSLVTLENFDLILRSSDGIYLDRVRLGMCIPVENMFIVSKMIVSKCNDSGKPCIVTAVLTEELAHICVTDIANLVYDGVDVIAMNFHYDKVEQRAVNQLNTTKVAEQCLAALFVACKLAESTMWNPLKYGKVDCMSHLYTDKTNTTCATGIELAIRSQAAAIICITNSGRAARHLSCSKVPIPIVIVTRVCRTARILRFWRGIRAVHYFEDFKPDFQEEMDARIRAGVEYAKNKRILVAGDPYVAILWSIDGIGHCNTVRLFYASARNTLSQFIKEDA